MRESKLNPHQAKQPPRIKMCGLSREQDITCVSTLLPDFVGFVFASSPRQVSITQAAHLKSLLDSRIKAVGVFVGESVDEIVELVDSGVIDYIQLHDSSEIESSENFTRRESRILALRQRTSAPIIKAITASNVPNILAQQESTADLLLLDNAKGGSGKCFDWDYVVRAREAGFDREFFLAGGINAGNLSRALALHPYGIDLSKGLESNGAKDCAKMHEIMEILRDNLTH